MRHQQPVMRRAHRREVRDLVGAVPTPRHQMMDLETATSRHSPAPDTARHAASTARRSFGDRRRRRPPIADHVAVVVDEHRCDRRVRPQLLQQRIGDRDPGDLRRPLQRHRDLDAGQRRQVTAPPLVDRRVRVTQREQRVSGPLLERSPRLTLDLHLLGQMRDRLLELCAHRVGQLAPQRQHRLVAVPPHPQLTAPRGAPANPPPTACSTFRA